MRASGASFKSNEVSRLFRVPLRRRHLTPRRNERSGTADAKLGWRDPCGPGGLGQGSCQASFPSWAYHHIVRIQKWSPSRVPFEGGLGSALAFWTAQFLFGTMCDMSGRGSKGRRDSPPASRWPVLLCQVSEWSHREFAAAANGSRGPRYLRRHAVYEAQDRGPTRRVGTDAQERAS